MGKRGEVLSGKKKLGNGNSGNSNGIGVTVPVNREASSVVDVLVSGRWEFSRETNRVSSVSSGFDLLPLEVRSLWNTAELAISERTG